MLFAMVCVPPGSSRYSVKLSYGCQKQFTCTAHVLCPGFCFSFSKVNLIKAQQQTNAKCASFCFSRSLPGRYCSCRGKQLSYRKDLSDFQKWKTVFFRLKRKLLCLEKKADVLLTVAVPIWNGYREGSARLQQVTEITNVLLAHKADLMPNGEVIISLNLFVRQHGGLICASECMFMVIGLEVEHR